MKFFAKSDRSELAGMRYQRSGHNDVIRDALVREQQGFCAYSEVRFRPRHTVAIEHFDSRLKDREDDDHRNWYAVLQKYNQLKRRKEGKYESAAFFESRFFQREGEFEERVRYVRGAFVYESVDVSDSEAEQLVDYLGLNSPQLAIDRARHIKRLREHFADAGYDAPAQLKWLLGHTEDLDYITVIEQELDLEVTPLPPAELA